jgi:ABC-type nickel/cobalt efflux system permease component RcnA
LHDLRPLAVYLLELCDALVSAAYGSGVLPAVAFVLGTVLEPVLETALLVVLVQDHAEQLRDPLHRIFG